MPSVSMSLDQIAGSGPAARADHCAFSTSDDAATDTADSAADESAFSSAVMPSAMATLLRRHAHSPKRRQQQRDAQDGCDQSFT